MADTRRSMSRLSPSFDSQSELGSINASLFYQLAQLLLWGKEHPEVVAAYAHFADLLQTAGSALMEGGILDIKMAFRLKLWGRIPKVRRPGWYSERRAWHEE